jgi:PBP4 family serine-type D-alanyl-D-alanine carboxypeptidase
MLSRIFRQRAPKGPLLVLCGFLLSGGVLGGESKPASGTAGLADRIQEIISRPEFGHASFGIEFYCLDTGKAVYALNEEKLFTPASTTKLLTEGTALELLGTDYRFHTRIYRTGPIETDGTLKGDLILVASGDPNLSGRLRPDGTLAFENVDHTYAGSPDTRAVPGDPLLVVRELAEQVAAHGVKRVEGRFLVDSSLFPEGDADRGTGIIISPIAVNDNVIDVTAGPGAAVGAPVKLEVSPVTAYVRFVNQAKTGPADSKPEIKWERDLTNADGSHVVTVTGNIPLSSPPILFAYSVPQPTRFAEMVFVDALGGKGVVVVKAESRPPDFKFPTVFYTPANLVAEHVSPPLSEEVKVTLKVSQNLHAGMMPYILGAILAHKSNDAAQAGFDLEREFLQKGGLDLSGASQGDGEGGAASAFFTPDFMVHYLAYMSKQKDFATFFNALPILGRDGTLWNIQTTSPAAGQVHAKTGTFAAYDALNRRLMLTGKGLAGYVTTPDGRHLAFAMYVNRVSLPADDEAPTKVVGQALGEIAAASYLSQ